MAQESCNLDQDEVEIIKPSTSSSPPPPPLASSTSSSPPLPPSLLAKHPQEFPPKRRATREPQSSGAPAEAEGNQPAVHFVNRCFSCYKRVGLTGFRCRCGHLFCPHHRYSDSHDCSFDYKGAGRAEISKNNPLIRAAKIIKI